MANIFLISIFVLINSCHSRTNINENMGKNDTYFLESLVKTFGYTEDEDLLNWVMQRNK